MWQFYLLLLSFSKLSLLFFSFYPNYLCRCYHFIQIIFVVVIILSNLSYSQSLVLLHVHKYSVQLSIDSVISMHFIEVVIIFL